jgi:hypothetical protein
MTISWKEEGGCFQDSRVRDPLLLLLITAPVCTATRPVSIITAATVATAITITAVATATAVTITAVAAVAATATVIGPVTVLTHLPMPVCGM